MSVALLILFALLPLQWIALSSSAAGVGSLHELAIVCFTGFVVLRLSARTYSPVLRTGAVFVIASLYMIAAVGVVSLYLGGPLIPAIKQLLYLLSSVCLAAFYYRAVRWSRQDIITATRYVVVVLCASLLAGLGLAMAVNGVNPVQGLIKSVAAADPEIFQREVFMESFVGFGLSEDEVAGNLRHEIYGALLLSMAMSAWAMKVGAEPSPRQERLYRIAMGVGVTLLLISMSRSVLLAAAVWPVLSVVRSIRRGEVSGRQLWILSGSVLVLGGVVVSGLGAVIYNRFFVDTTGYGARAGNYTVAVDALRDHWLTGGYATADVSTHNLVFDTLLRSGIFAAVPALVLVVTVAVAFGWLVAALDRMPPPMVAVAVALGLPLVRMLTNGGGQVPPAGWVALGFAGGVLTAWRVAAVDERVQGRDIELAGV